MSPQATEDRLHIVAAVLVRRDGRVLATTRPEGRSMAGRWEFPGGKLEIGESRWDGLLRELDEELGLQLLKGRPLIRLHHDYDGGPFVDLDVWRVNDWRGEPRAREAQQFDWFEPDALTGLDFLDANTPIVAAARLPDRYLITPDERDHPDDIPAGVEVAAHSGVRLIQLRGAWLQSEKGPRLAAEAVERARAQGAKVVVNGDPGLAGQCGADGVHLPARHAIGLQKRPVARPSLLGVSCHSERELRHAEALGADFVTLGHVRPTPSHPDRPPLGLPRFLELADSARLPVYAIGGMTPDDLPELHRHSIQGIAAIRALWPGATRR